MLLTHECVNVVNEERQDVALSQALVTVPQVLANSKHHVFYQKHWGEHIAGRLLCCCLGDSAAPSNLGAHNVVRRPDDEAFVEPSKKLHDFRVIDEAVALRIVQRTKEVL